MRELFEKDREKPFIPNHMPPVAGAILWSSGLLQVLKASVLAFKELPEVFDFDQAEHVFGNYLSFAKSITAYQNGLVKQWQVSHPQKASCRCHFTKAKILFLCWSSKFKCLHATGTYCDPQPFV